MRCKLGVVVSVILNIRAAVALALSSSVGSTRRLLSVDCGNKVGGTALYDGNGRLLAYESFQCDSNLDLSENFIPAALAAACAHTPAVDHLMHMYVEGMPELCEQWMSRAGPHCECVVVPPELWRQSMLLPREKQGSTRLKAAARYSSSCFIRKCYIPLKAFLWP
jgi:hypothetical protein